MASPKVEAMVSSWSDTLAARFASLRGPDPAYAPGAHYMERYDMASFGGRLLFFLDQRFHFVLDFKASKDECQIGQQVEVLLQFSILLQE